MTLAVFLTAAAVLSVAAGGFRPPREAQAQTAPATQPDAAAADPSEKFTPEIPIPGVFTGEQDADDSLLARYIRAIYIYFVWVVGIVAVVMVMYGGIRWVAAAGNPGQIKEARDIIDNAVIGVLIALASVVLLNIINPKLTQLAIPGITSISAKYFKNAHAPEICPREPKIPCGELKKIGTAEVDSEKVDKYCMGTTCPQGVIEGAVSGHTEICSLAKDSKNNFKPHQGCTDILAAEGGGTWPVAISINLAPGLKLTGWGCGIIAPAKDSVFGWCESAVATGQGADPQCYLIGPKTQPKMSQAGFDFIPNICCPGYKCPRKDLNP